MGYRSEVVLAITPEAAPAFMAMLAKNPKSMEMCQNADTFQSGYENSGDWLVYWSSIKWYEGYEDIDPINDFIDALASDDMSEYGLDEAPPGKHRDGTTYERAWEEFFSFLRIGEDTNDIRKEGCAFDGIGVSRSIYF